MNIWTLIIFSALTILLFRALPFAFKNSEALNNKTGSFYRFISYSSQAMLGVIIYDTAFRSYNITNLISEFQLIDTVKLILFFSIFFVVVKTKKILPSFLAGLFIYFLILIFQNGGFK